MHNQTRCMFIGSSLWNINTLRPRLNGHHFADSIFKCIFLNENVLILIKNLLKFVPEGPIHNMAALVQIMAWRHPGAKEFSEPMMVRLPMHICATLPQWVKMQPIPLNGLCTLWNSQVPYEWIPIPIRHFTPRQHKYDKVGVGCSFNSL